MFRVGSQNEAVDIGNSCNSITQRSVLCRKTLITLGRQHAHLFQEDILAVTTDSVDADCARMSCVIAYQCVRAKFATMREAVGRLSAIRKFLISVFSCK